MYFDNGASASQPFNFAGLAVTLCPRNPWVRATPGNAYSDGYRFWKGVASLVGVAVLKDLMAEFYRTRRARPVTTAQIEAFLVARTGHALLVDGFHRFVYSFANPAPAPDVWLRDDPSHAGSEAWGGRVWDSPDLWVRNADDGGAAGGEAERGGGGAEARRARAAPLPAAAREVSGRQRRRVPRGREGRRIMPRGGHAYEPPRRDPPGALGPSVLAPEA